jgi:hypothetical protein
MDGILGVAWVGTEERVGRYMFEGGDWGFGFSAILVVRLGLCVEVCFLSFLDDLVMDLCCVGSDGNSRHDLLLDSTTLSMQVQHLQIIWTAITIPITIELSENYTLSSSCHSYAEHIPLTSRTSLLLPIHPSTLQYHQNSSISKSHQERETKAKKIYCHRHGTYIKLPAAAAAHTLPSSRHTRPTKSEQED